VAVAICITKRGDGAASEVRLPYGESADGRLLHISAVPSGLACACKCPACGTSLVARKGQQLEHHFAHRSSAACAKALESALHKLAKQVIADHRRVGLPAVEAVVGDERRLVYPEMVFDGIDVTLEEGMDGLRPDIVARKADRELLVEVAVTHFCDDQKIALIRERELATIEIDLRGVRLDLPAADVEAAILVSTPRRWLYNRRLDEAVAELIVEREERALEELARKERAVRAMAERFAQEWRSAPQSDEAKRLAAGAADKLRDLADAGIAWAIDQPTGGDGGFRVGRRVWQAVVLHHIIHPRWADPPVYARDVLDLLKEANLVKEGLSSFVSEDVAKTARFIESEFMSPYEAVWEYLAHLEEKEVLRFREDYRGDYWVADGDIVRKASAGIRVERDKRGRVESVRRAVGMLQLGIHRATGDNGPGINVDWWMRTRHRGLDAAPEALAAKGRFHADELLAHLRRLSAMVLGEGLVEEDLLGLPLEAFRERRRQVVAEENRRLEEERRAAAEAARLRAEQEQRDEIERKRLRAKEEQDSIVAKALTYMGDQEGQHFVAAPLDCLGGLALAQLEGVTPAQGGAVRTLLEAEISRLNAIWERQRQTADCRYRLQQAAVAFHGEERAQLWMRSAHPGLSGKRPQDVAVDEDGLERCLRLLRPGGKRR
jgi:hypothetical protein